MHVNVCISELSVMIRKDLVCFSNILLHDYSSTQTHKESTAQIDKNCQNFNVNDKDNYIIFNVHDHII